MGGGEWHRRAGRKAGQLPWRKGRTTEPCRPTNPSVAPAPAERPTAPLRSSLPAPAPLQLRSSTAALRTTKSACASSANTEAASAGTAGGSAQWLEHATNRVAPSCTTDGYLRTIVCLLLLAGHIWSQHQLLHVLAGRVITWRMHLSLPRHAPPSCLASIKIECQCLCSCKHHQRFFEGIGHMTAGAGCSGLAAAADTASIQNLTGC